MCAVFSFLRGMSFGAAITVIGSWIVRKRQEAIKMLNIISNAVPYYNQLARSLEFFMGFNSWTTRL
jgi:hypothetical protein